MQHLNHQNLTETQRLTLDAAEKVMQLAYNPYSHFYVGAAVLAKNGTENRIISGSNVENAAYGSAICAERAAVVSANALGIRVFEKVAIIARGANFDTTKITGPCGECRQVLYEFAQISGVNLEIVMSTTKKDQIVVATIEELLPFAFGPLDLGIDIEKYR
ncbi:cytidine deaminase [Candidatus Woesearchaeota archaeon]|nr:cytidine deaminase [Candidatus Woesearchaeota archaeon]